MPLTSSMEDYLEAVLVLQQQKGYVRCVDVAVNILEEGKRIYKKCA